MEKAPQRSGHDVGHGENDDRDRDSPQKWPQLGECDTQHGGSLVVGVKCDERDSDCDGHNGNHEGNELRPAEKRRYEVDEGEHRDTGETRDDRRPEDVTPFMTGTRPPAELPSDEQEQRDSGDVVEPDDLDHDRQTAREPRHPQPSPLLRLDPTGQGGHADGREEEVEPRRHRRRVIRDRPHDDRHRRQRSGDRRHEPGREIEERNDEPDEERQHCHTQPEEVGAEDPEHAGVEERESARVGVDEVAMRELTLEHAERRLAERPFVPREPPLIQRRDHVETAQPDSDCEHEPEVRGARGDAVRAPRPLVDRDSHAHVWLGRATTRY